jgi:anti-anti-sigma factor
MNEFRVDSRHLGPGSIEIRVEGEIDLSVADRFEAVLDQSSSNDQVVIDLSACEFIDSTAIAIMLHKRKQLEAEGGRLVACGAAGQVQRILDVAGLKDKGFGFERPDEALSSENIA